MPVQTLPPGFERLAALSGYDEARMLLDLGVWLTVNTRAALHDEQVVHVRSLNELQHSVLQRARQLFDGVDNWPHRTYLAQLRERAEQLECLGHLDWSLEQIARTLDPH